MSGQKDKKDEIDHQLSDGLGITVKMLRLVGMCKRKKTSLAKRWIYVL